jgi:hypothetical protein
MAVHLSSTNGKKIMLLGLEEKGWLWAIIIVFGGVIISMLSYWLGIQNGLEIFDNKLNEEIDKRMRWFLEKNRE